MANPYRPAARVARLPPCTMHTTHPDPEQPPTPPLQPDPLPLPDDWVLTRAAPLLGLAILGSFAAGVLVGVVKDIPPLLGGMVTALLGLRAVGRGKD